MSYPPILDKHRLLLQITGILRYNRLNEHWKNLCVTIYFIFVHCFYTMSMISHAISTVTRSFRYLPEFYQRLLEDLGFTLFYFEAVMFTYHGRQLDSLMSYIETEFSQADDSVFKKNELILNILFYGGVSGMILTLAVSLLETYIPVSEEEQELLRYIYERKHPERKFVTNFWIPYIDDSESPYYEAIFNLEFYQFFLTIVMGFVSMTTIACLIIHLIGQYEILAQFMERLGREEQADGSYKYYTNFERNEFVTRSLAYAVQEREQYEQNFCHQLIQFHQKLLHFQEKMFDYYSPNMFVKVALNNAMFALCMYQITCMPESLSKTHAYKLLVELVAVGFQYFFLCNLSDFLDSCNPMLEQAAGRSAWYRCSSRTRRDLCLLIRRVQRPNHLRFYQGVIILNRSYFAQVVKLSYSVVNFMRMKSDS